ncbi:MAG: cysteine desulfurase [Bacteroidales bacterium]|jgi:cysteine desulfurase/selenocysteine lyase|nr:cysteine desulfurase [Bacteroidales bacterium]
MSINVEQLRREFPVLSQTVNGKPLVYLDNAATTQKPKAVVERLMDYYYKENSNIHRGAHYLSMQATEAYEEARETTRMYLNAAFSREIIFTRGTTESINLVASSFSQKFLKEGDEILISAMEHHSNIVPWQMACQQKGATLKVIPMDEQGVLRMDTLDELLTEKTRLVAVSHVSNALGTINPVEDIIGKAHQKGIPVLIDGAQAVPHMKVDVQKLDCDFYCFSGHKLYGPMGVGVLYGKEEWLEQMPPYQGGGEMIKEVRFTGTTYNELPFKFEAGTPNVGDVLGLEAALRFVSYLRHDVISVYEDSLMQYAMKQLATLPGIRFIGTAEHKTSVISFLFDDIHPYDSGVILDKLGIAVRTGHHCAQPVMDFFNIPGTIRVSFAMYNSLKEIDLLMDALKKVRTLFS